MNHTRSMAALLLLAMGSPGLWDSRAVAQYVDGEIVYTPGYYAPLPAHRPYYYAAPAPSFRYSAVVPGGPIGTSYQAPSVRRMPLRNSGLEPRSLPAQIAEDIAPASAAPRLGPTWRASRWQGPMWRKTSRNW